jgi:purine-cytosine permease-like protein
MKERIKGNRKQSSKKPYNRRYLSSWFENRRIFYIFLMILQDYNKQRNNKKDILKMINLYHGYNGFFICFLITVSNITTNINSCFPILNQQREEVICIMINIVFYLILDCCINIRMR